MTRAVPLDAELLDRAEEIARARNMSIEAYLERLLHVVTQPPLSKEEMGPLIRQLAGSLPPLTDEEGRATIEQARMEKYGK